jgi:hypothetical protein
MKSFATKALPAKPARLAPSSLLSKSEVWLQHELDVATLNAEKNRSIQDSVDASGRATRSQSTNKKSVSTSSADTHMADSQISSRTDLATLSASQKSSFKLQESSIIEPGHLLISKQRVAEGQSAGVGSLQTQFQSMIGEWGCAIKQAMFPEEMALNDDARHSRQLLILL